MTPLTDWPLVLSILAVAGAVGGFAIGVAVIHGTMREKVRALEAWKVTAEAEMKATQQSLARGDTRFSELRMELRAMRGGIDDIKEELRELIGRRATPRVADDRDES